MVDAFRSTMFFSQRSGASVLVVAHQLNHEHWEGSLGITHGRKPKQADVSLSGIQYSERCSSRITRISLARRMIKQFENLVEIVCRGV